MNEFKIYKDKLFPKFNGVNLQSLKIDHDCVSFVTPHNDAKKITEIVLKHMKKYKIFPKNTTVVDATACVGGDSIMLCHVFGKVVSIELDTQRYNNLVHNLNQYKFNNAITVNGDSTIIIQKLPIIDIIFVDVPWGGKDYKFKDKLRLNFGNISLEQFILNCFDAEIMKSLPKIIISKMPKNYDMQYFYTTLSPELEITLYELKKMNIMIIENKKFIKIELVRDINLMTSSLINEIIQNAINNVSSNLSVNRNVGLNTDLNTNLINNSNINLTDTKTTSIENYGSNLIQSSIQQWDCSEDFSISLPDKKTNILF